MRYRRALIALNRGLVEDMRIDIEIALKFEPKNKFVPKELNQLEEKYEERRKIHILVQDLIRGRSSLNPLEVQCSCD